MPYIRQEKREAIDPMLADVRAHVCSDPATGGLNYIITRIVDAYLGTRVSYATLNAAIGVLECVKLELYRRLAAPYEDAKASENGDVYTASAS